MKQESGFMIVKNGKAWGVIYSDGKSTEEGWCATEDAKIYGHELRKTTDATYTGSHLEGELKTGKIVRVNRITLVEIEG